MAEVLPLKTNTVYNAALPSRYVGSLTNRLSLYRPVPGEQGWAEIADANFTILNTAAMTDTNNDFLSSTLQRFLGQIEVEWPLYSRKAAAPRRYVDNYAAIAGMGGF